MRKLKRFDLRNAQILSNDDLQKLTGGILRGAAICSAGSSCTFYYGALKETISGTCSEYYTATSFVCYCKGNNLSGGSYDCMTVV